MRIALDPEVCTGHGRCYALAPEVFAPDDEGHCEVVHEDVPPEHESTTRTAVNNCPEGALTLVDDG